MPARVPTKRAILLRMLSEGMVLVHLDARRDGVQVPQKHATDSQLRLNLSHRFASRDLTLAEEEITCTLSFGGVPYSCRLPYASIYAAASHVTGEAVVWREDLPEGLDGPFAEATPSPAVRPAPAHAPAEKTPAPAPARSRNHLRLIK